MTVTADYLLEAYGGRLSAASDGYTEADRIIAEIRLGKAAAPGPPRPKNLRLDAQDNAYLLGLIQYMMRALQNKK